MSLVKLKDPNATVDWTFDWDDGYLDATSSPRETISTSTWAIDDSPSPAELSVDSDSNTTTTATAFFTGGVAGKVYRARNRIVTSAGRTDDRTITIRVEHR